MSNTSATGGYLAPLTSPAPLEDDALVNLLHDIVVGLTGLSGSLVRPRWQPEPPTQPSISTTWAAVGVSNRKSSAFEYTQHDGNNSGADITLRTEELTVLCSFYGPAADNCADLVRNGLGVPQNRDALTAVGLSVIDVGDATPIPSLVNNRWYYRLDMPLNIRRTVVRVYPVLSLLSAHGQLETDVSRIVKPLTVEGD